MAPGVFPSAWRISPKNGPQKTSSDFVKGKVVLRYYVSVALLLSIASFSTGCKRQLEPEGYRVVAYDGHTYQWTIIRTGTFDGQYLKKRLVVVCSSYKWGNHESVNGPEACHLQVGRMIVPNPLPGQAHRDQFIDVFEMPDQSLSITEGDGEDRTMQQFKIMSYEVVTP
jgi:hypothetical protein